MEHTPQAMDRINRRAWRARSALRWYGTIEGFVDVGERDAFERVKEDARGQPVLDLGVGGGRTTALLLPLGPEYVGVDYTPPMIDLARRRFPGVKFEVGDARDLSRFPSSSFRLVLFSFNGLDAVGVDGRRRVLAEVFRLLRPGGAFFFSTFNRDGPDFATRFRAGDLRPTRSLIRRAVRVARHAASTAVGFLRYLSNRRLERREEGHSVLLHSAHNYGILVYAGTLAEVREQLREAGFAPELEVFGSDHGGPTVDEVAGADRYVHIIARKPHPLAGRAASGPARVAGPDGEPPPPRADGEG